jgi:hypothetical protein
MRTVSDRRQRVVAALLVVAAVLFVVGVAAEPAEGAHGDEPSGDVAGRSESGEAGHSEAGESAEERARDGEAHEAAEAGDEERVLGLDLESPGAVAAGLVVSAVLAALVVWRPDRRALVVVALVAAGFAVLDIAEVARQVDEDRPGLAALAATIAAMHAATVAGAVWLVTARAPAGAEA